MNYEYGEQAHSTIYTLHSTIYTLLSIILLLPGWR